MPVSLKANARTALVLILDLEPATSGVCSYEVTRRAKFDECRSLVRYRQIVSKTDIAESKGLEGCHRVVYSCLVWQDIMGPSPHFRSQLDSTSAYTWPSTMQM